MTARVLLFPALSEGNGHANVSKDMYGLPFRCYPDLQRHCWCCSFVLCKTMAEIHPEPWRRTHTM